MREEFIPFYKNGIIVQMDGDSGDSCQRSGTFLFLDYIVNGPSPLIAARMFFEHQSSRGRFRRTNNPAHWGVRPSNCSRDQISIMRLALSVYNSYSFNISYMKQLFRLGFYQNFLRGTDDPDECWKIPDFMSPPELANVIRHNRIYLLYPLVFILDLGFIFDVLTRKSDSWDRDNMLAQNLYYAVLKMPTPVAKLAFGLYTRTNYMDRIENYYSAQNNGIPPMSDLFKQADRMIRSRLWLKSWWLRSFFPGAHT